MQDYATYFVAANDNAVPVWVHNCDEITDPLPKKSDDLKNAGHTGAASEFKTTDGKTYYDASGHTPNDQMTGKIIGIRNVNEFSGACSEVGCMEQALKNGSPLKGGKMLTVQVGDENPTRPHGASKPACSTCKDILDAEGIEEIK